MTARVPSGAAPEHKPLLDARDHSRAAAGLRYVYPVVSRRAVGVSIGINLNTNQACNWACIYCQVPGLTRGSAPAVDLGQLRQEFDTFLREVLYGDFMLSRVPEAMRRLNDIAFSGNGEPTASPDFAAAVQVVLERLAVLRQEGAGVPAVRSTLDRLKLVLISNGSQFGKRSVLQALRALAAQRGELWFKLDAGTRAGRRQINGVDLGDDSVCRQLVRASGEIPTWLQTCLLRLDGADPPHQQLDTYRALVQQARAAGAQIAGVLLYTLARPSLQPQAARLAAVGAEPLECWAQALRGDGLVVRVST